MSSVVRRGAQYIANYSLVNGHFNFKWTRDLKAALPMNDQFAGYIGRVVNGKVIPIVDAKVKTRDNATAKSARR